MDVDTSSAESTSSDTPSPTMPMKNPEPSPFEEPDPESQGRTGSAVSNEMADEDERWMDLDYMGGVFDDAGAEMESPVAGIPGVSLFILHSISYFTESHLSSVDGLIVTPRDLRKVIWTCYWRTRTYLLSPV